MPRQLNRLGAKIHANLHVEAVDVKAHTSLAVQTLLTFQIRKFNQIDLVDVGKEVVRGARTGVRGSIDGHAIVETWLGND